MEPQTVFLTRDQIEQALRRLGEIAVSHGETIEALIVGGAAMILGYNARPSTRDVDGVFFELLFPRLPDWARGGTGQRWDTLSTATETDVAWFVLDPPNGACSGKKYANASSKTFSAAASRPGAASWRRALPSSSA